MSPLFFFGPQAATAESAKPQFEVSVAYAYVGSATTSVPLNSSDPMSVKFGPWITVPTIEYTFGFNVTRTDDPATSKAQAVFEYFVIRVSSDKGYVGNVTFYAVAFTDWAKSKFYFSRDGWFDSNVTAGSGQLDWKVGETSQVGMGGQATDWYPSFGSPSSITLTVSRLGMVVLDANSTVAYPESPAVIAQARLASNGTAFLYNELPVPPAKP
ncbi:MAG TPA: hypothetical protein VMS77_05815 [Conexivisphaerales archaeon]|nr:hypothetical protein [Conexivisphaerales archaeon]